MNRGRRIERASMDQGWTEAKGDGLGLRDRNPYVFPIQ